MFKSNSFSTKRAYDAPLCEALEVQINEGVLLNISGGETQGTNWSEKSGGAGGSVDYYNYDENGGSF